MQLDGIRPMARRLRPLQQFLLAGVDAIVDRVEMPLVRPRAKERMTQRTVVDAGLQIAMQSLGHFGRHTRMTKEAQMSDA